MIPEISPNILYKILEVHNDPALAQKIYPINVPGKKNDASSLLYSSQNASRSYL